MMNLELRIGENVRSVTTLKLFCCLLVAVFGLSINTPNTQAQSLDLLWQGVTYAPPFYKGRTLWTNQSRVLVMGMPTNIQNPSSLLYHWAKNGTYLGGDRGINGIGRETLIFTDQLGFSQNVSLEILIPEDHTRVASRSTSLSPQKVSLLVYENNPLYGLMLHREVGEEYNISEREVTFVAIPMFFNIDSNINPELKYSWRTNNNSLEARESITFRTTTDEKGQSRVGLRISNDQKVTQSSNKEFIVNFGK